MAEATQARDQARVDTEQAIKAGEEALGVLTAARAELDEIRSKSN